MKILIADSNTVNQKITQHILSQREIQSDFGNDATELINLLNENNYLLILIDLNMLLNNEESIQQNLMTKLNQTPLIAFTEPSDFKAYNLSSSLRIDGILNKPYEMRELFEMIEKHTPYNSNVREKESQEEFKKSLFKYADNSAEFAFELVDCFIENYEGYKEQVALALTKKDPKSLKEAIHKIETSNRIFSINSLEEVTEKIKCLIHKPTSEIDRNIINQLELKCDSIIIKLDSVKQNIKS
ncbi:MAG: response regulator [Reichenbachiella sp.]|uniref:response regulator n=1 Tax=Reichenbachiella sp. TaxID=2184521 RepID=UPI003262E218